MGAGYGLSGLCMAWAHEICADDNEERAIVVASMNEMAYVLQAWLPLLVWQQVDAPQYRKGFITITVLSASLIVTGFITKALHKRQNRRQSYHSQAQEQHFEDQITRSSGEDVGSDHIHITAKD